jgi:hypothetical protein
MKIPYPVVAILVGLVGFAGVELAGMATGTITAITRSVWLDAVSYALGTLLLGVAFAPLFRRAAGVAVVGVVVAFLLLYAPLVAALAGVLELTVTGAWGFQGLVRSAFIASPINLVMTFVLEVWFVAVPLGVLSVLVLWRQARAAPPIVPRVTARRSRS